MQKYSNRANQVANCHRAKKERKQKKTLVSVARIVLFCANSITRPMLKTLVTPLDSSSAADVSLSHFRITVAQC